MQFDDKHLKIVKGYQPPEPNDYGQVDQDSSFCTLQFDAGRTDTDHDGEVSGIGLDHDEALRLYRQLHDLLWSKRLEDMIIPDVPTTVEEMQKLPVLDIGNFDEVKDG